DGIRDYKVTGVQTCALPILIHKMTRKRGNAIQWQCILRGTSIIIITITTIITITITITIILILVILWITPHRFATRSVGHANTRSEERRVGKECRSGWLPSE